MSSGNGNGNGTGGTGDVWSDDGDGSKVMCAVTYAMNYILDELHEEYLKTVSGDEGVAKKVVKAFHDDIANAGEVSLEEKFYHVLGESYKSEQALKDPIKAMNEAMKTAVQTAFPNLCNYAIAIDKDKDKKTLQQHFEQLYPLVSMSKITAVCGLDDDAKVQLFSDIYDGVLIPLDVYANLDAATQTVPAESRYQPDIRTLTLDEHSNLDEWIHEHFFNPRSDISSARKQLSNTTSQSEHDIETSWNESVKVSHNYNYKNPEFQERTRISNGETATQPATQSVSSSAKALITTPKQQILTTPKQPKRLSTRVPATKLTAAGGAKASINSKKPGARVNAKNAR